MSVILAADGLGKRFGRRWALRECTFEIPARRVVGLVGPNGAGKSTLLHIAVGLLEPTAGRISVLGAPPAETPAQLGRVGFVAQQSPLYPSLTVADHLRLGAWLNPSWDADLAEHRITELGLDPKQRAGKLSGGQHAQLALTLAIAKRPQLLVLDEPVASLDPLARHEFLQRLMAAVAEDEMTVILSSHLVADLERVCDYLIVLTEAQVQLVGDVDDLLACHYRLTGPRRDPADLPPGQQVIEASHTDRQSTLFIRTDGPIFDPAWTVEPVGLESLVLAYMRQADATDRGLLPHLGVTR
ncbi:MAG: ABC transporter ATP-binding protein [Jatrophihabitantaceae bacterium]